MVGELDVRNRHDPPPLEAGAEAEVDGLAASDGLVVAAQLLPDDAAVRVEAAHHVIDLHGPGDRVARRSGRDMVVAARVQDPVAGGVDASVMPQLLRADDAEPGRRVVEGPAQGGRPVARVHDDVTVEPAAQFAGGLGRQAVGDDTEDPAMPRLQKPAERLPSTPGAARPAAARRRRVVGGPVVGHDDLQRRRVARERLPQRREQVVDEITSAGFRGCPPVVEVRDQDRQANR